jgi:hypothetical protein
MACFHGHSFVVSIKDPKGAKLYWTLVQAGDALWLGFGLQQRASKSWLRATKQRKRQYHRDEIRSVSKIVPAQPDACASTLRSRHVRPIGNTRATRLRWRRLSYTPRLVGRFGEALWLGTRSARYGQSPLPRERRFVVSVPQRNERICRLHADAREQGWGGRIRRSK